MVKINQRQELKQKLSPKQILQAKLFQLNTFSIEQRIYKELEKNPVLEIAEPSDDTPIDEGDSSSEDFEVEELYSNTDDFELYTINTKDKSYIDSIDFDKKDLRDLLKDQIRDMGMSLMNQQIAYEIIDNLDQKGYLGIEPILIADRFNVALDCVNDVKSKIMLLDPAGVASLNIRECLLSQLKFQNHSNSIAFRIISDFFEDFSKANYDRICSGLNISKNDVKEAFDIISGLYLYPGDGMINLDKGTIIPDLIVERREESWVIMVNDSSIPEVILNKRYSDMLRDKSMRSNAKTFIKKNYNQAKMFLDAINERKKTMVAVMNAIIVNQIDFFDTDNKVLRPMLIKDLAKDLNLDISTISRICNGKYVQLPWGIFELRFFFNEGVKMKDGGIVSNTLLKSDIQTIINQESSDKPLRDSDIVKELDIKGYKIARRTVTKYREALNIPNSIVRKKIKGLQKK
ncbi:MAG: RNA polymerase sigma-54 factor [Candidatus Marinimicrobia bacterium]|nr:RNA polymerase sigma-54 factor [Candidatus Neomarinimicrobiota bacterium]